VAVNDWLKEKDSLQLGSLMGPEESTVTPEQIISDSARTAIPGCEWKWKKNRKSESETRYKIGLKNLRIWGKCFILDESAGHGSAD
jgi:hypothetical protein